MDWWQIAGVVLFILSILFGAKWKQAKGLLKELAEALTTLSDVLADDDISPAERTKVLKELSDVLISAKALLGK